MGRVAVITGASAGIGAATLGLFRSCGWRVLAIDCEPSPGEEDFLQLDLGSADAACVLEEAMKALGQIDAVVNNAAVQLTKPLVETTIDDWQYVLGVNVLAPATVIKAAMPQMRDGGAIVNVGSVHAVATSPGLAAYVTSKGAVTAMTRAAALEFAPRGIRVNCVLPGAVDTAMLQNGLGRYGEEESSINDAIASLAAKTPLGRVGRPQDIAEAVLFLADSTRSSFITGQTLIVDGGATARLSTE